MADAAYLKNTVGPVLQKMILKVRTTVD